MQDKPFHNSNEQQMFNYCHNVIQEHSYEFLKNIEQSINVDTRYHNVVELLLVYIYYVIIDETSRNLFIKLRSHTLRFVTEFIGVYPIGSVKEELASIVKRESIDNCMVWAGAFKTFNIYCPFCGLEDEIEYAPTQIHQMIRMAYSSNYCRFTDFHLTAYSILCGLYKDRFINVYGQADYDMLFEILQKVFYDLSDYSIWEKQQNENECCSEEIKTLEDEMDNLNLV